MILSPSVFRHTPLSQFQTVNDPARPLSAMPEYEQEEVWVRLAETIFEALSAPLPLGARLLTYAGHSDSVLRVAWSPNGRSLASASSDKTIQVLDMRGNGLPVTCVGHENIVFAVAWSPDGKRIASASMDATVRIWDAASGQCLITYTGHGAEVMDVAWSPVPLSKNYTGPVSQMSNAALVPDGYLLASASADKTVHVWDASNGECFVAYTGHEQPVNGVAWSPDAQFLVSGCGQAGDAMPGTVQVWDMSPGQPIFTYADHQHGVNSVGWSPSGSAIASADQSGVLYVRSMDQLVAR